MNRAAAATARRLRNYLNALSLDLALMQTAAERRAVKVAIRRAEIALTELAVGQ